MKKLPLFILFLLLSITTFSQVSDYEIGSSPNDRGYRQGGLYDYSDPSSVNMKVAVWGFVRYPGRYIVPVGTSIADLLSYAGGPTEDANLEDIRLYRTLKDSSQIMMKVNYNDLFWGDHLTSKRKFVPEIKGGDIVVAPGEPRLFFKDWFSITLSVISTLISLSILVLNIIRK